MEVDPEAIENILHDWSTYIGKRYIKLRATGETGSTSSYLVNALGNLKYLTNYSLNLAPPFKLVFDAFDENHVQLEHLVIHLESHYPIQEIFNSVKAAQSCSSLSSLAIECHATTNAMDLSLGLLPLDRSLRNLTHLNIDYGRRSADTIILLLDIIQNLTMLESLEFQGLLIVETVNLPRIEEVVKEYDDLSHSKIASCKLSKIKTLRLTTCLYTHDIQKDIFKKANGLFHFILQSCPTLETFEL